MRSRLTSNRLDSKKEPRLNSNLLVLPYDCISVISTFFEKQDTLVNFMSTGKTLYNLFSSPNFFSCDNLTFNVTSKSLERFRQIEYVPNASKFSLRTRNSRARPRWASLQNKNSETKHFPYVRKLQIGDSVEEPILLRFVNRLPHLKSVSLKFCFNMSLYVFDILREKRIRELKMSTNKFTDGVFKKLNLCHVERLDLSFVKVENFSYEHFKRVRYLKVTSFENVFREVDLRKLKLLKELEVNYHNGVSFLRGMDDLKVLKLRKCTGVKNSDFKALGSLEVLEIDECFSAMDESLSHVMFGNMKSLRMLSLYKMKEISLEFLNKVPKLKVLKYIECGELKFSKMTNHYLHKLKKLKICCERYVSAKQLKKVKCRKCNGFHMFCRYCRGCRLCKKKMKCKEKRVKCGTCGLYVCLKCEIICKTCDSGEAMCQGCFMKKSFRCNYCRGRVCGKCSICTKCKLPRLKKKKVRRWRK